jgi:threonine dehydratase
MISKESIHEAKKRLSSFLKPTPLIYSERLSKKYNADIWLKREDLTPVRSYKIRGAYNLMSSLTESEKEKWVVCASAGNHAQWVALSCKELKVKGTIFMPRTTPEQKVYKTTQFWGEYVNIILVGDTFDEAYAASKKYQEEHGSIFVHPFDDERIIAGQATVSLEILDSFREKNISPDYIICPIGGGWVISWAISTIKEFSPNTRIIWVEPAWAPSMKESLKQDKNIALEKVDIFVDGASVKRVGDKTFEICKNYNLEIITCPENRICSTILEFLKEDGIVVEPAGALACDALKDIQKTIEWKRVVLLISGWNFDFERLPEVKERSMKYEWLKRYFVVSFPQRPGALKDFLNCLWSEDDIARFEYLKKSNKDKAPVLIGIETKNKENFTPLTTKMEELGFKYQDITDNELYFDLLI